MTKTLILATAVLAVMPCLAQHTLNPRDITYTSDPMKITGVSSFVLNESDLHCKDNEKVVDHKEGTVHTFKCEVIPADPSKPDWKLQPVQHWFPTCSSGYELWWEPDPNLYGIMLTSTGTATIDYYLDNKIDIDSTYGPGNIPSYYECRPVGSQPKEKYPRNVWGGGGQ